MQCAEVNQYIPDVPERDPRILEGGCVVPQEFWRILVSKALSHQNILVDLEFRIQTLVADSSVGKEFSCWVDGRYWDLWKID